MKTAQFKVFEEKATEIGLVAIDRGNGHWQVKGKLLVNYYPKKGTIYIAGTTKGAYADKLEEVFKATSELPEVFSNKWFKKEKRKQNTAHKRRLFKIHPFCCWCQKKLEYKEASVEHVIPISKGGLNNANNFKLACIPCNSARGNSI